MLALKMKGKKLANMIPAVRLAKALKEARKHTVTHNQEIPDSLGSCTFLQRNCMVGGSPS